MRNKIIITIAIIALCVGATSVGAVSTPVANTAGALEQKIQAILEQIKELQKKVGALQQQKETVGKPVQITPVATTTFVDIPEAPQISCVIPKLKNGAWHKSVYLIQSLLTKEGYYKGPITGYYGQLTKAGVQAYQKANNILPNSGLVDQATAEALTHLVALRYAACNGVIAPTMPPIPTTHPPVPKIEIKGTLQPVTSPSIVQWGTHIITTDQADWCAQGECIHSQTSKAVVAQTYRVKASTDGVLKTLQAYEYKKVKVIGTKEYYALEGGFWGITAHDVKLIEETNPPITKEKLEVYNPTTGSRWKTGEKYVIGWRVETKNNINSNQRVMIAMRPHQADCLNSKTPCLMKAVAPYIIAESTENNGSYEWSIPSNMQSVYRGAQEIIVSIIGGSLSGTSNVFYIY